MIVIGLGNPGERYRYTRHNVGFMVIDHLAERCGIPLKKKLFRPVRTGEGLYRGKSLLLVKPLTFMNRSGEILPWLLEKYRGKTSEILIIADHLDLPNGSLRLREKGSSGGQRGLNSIIEFLETKDFPRLFIGIGRPREGTTVVDHVLGEAQGEESAVLEAACRRAAEAVLDLLETPIHRVMNDINRRKVD